MASNFGAMIPQLFGGLQQAMPQGPPPVSQPMMVIPSGLTAEQVMGMKAAHDASYAQKQDIAQRTWQTQQALQQDQQRMQFEKERSDAQLKMQEQQAEARNAAMERTAQMKVMAESIKMSKPFAIGNHTIAQFNGTGFDMTPIDQAEGKTFVDANKVPWKVVDGKVTPMVEGVDEFATTEGVAETAAEARAAATARHRAPKTGGGKGGSSRGTQEERDRAELNLDALGAKKYKYAVEDLGMDPDSALAYAKGEKTETAAPASTEGKGKSTDFIFDPKKGLIPRTEEAAVTETAAPKEEAKASGEKGIQLMNGKGSKITVAESKVEDYIKKHPEYRRAFKKKEKE